MKTIRIHGGGIHGVDRLTLAEAEALRTGLDERIRALTRQHLDVGHGRPRPIDEEQAAALGDYAMHNG